MINKTRIGLAGILFIAGVIAAPADSTQTQSFSTSGTIQAASWSGTFTLPDFDSGLGTLESVNLTLTLNDTPTIEVFNMASTAEAFTNASASFGGSLSAPGLVLAPSINATLASGTAQAGINTFATGPYSQVVTGSALGSTLNLWENQPGGVVDFSYSKGNPTFNGTDVDGQDLLFGGQLTGQGKVSVEYMYLSNGGTLATPEPRGWFLSELVALAMGGLAIIRARGIRFQA